MAAKTSTRGYGLLEGILARWRMRIAEQQIPPGSNREILVDFGCGLPPAFLEQSPFREKYGVDMRVDSTMSAGKGVHLISCNLRGPLPLNFANAHADVVTILATIEHIPEEHIPWLFAEARRILKPNGILIITPRHLGRRPC